MIQVKKEDFVLINPDQIESQPDNGKKEGDKEKGGGGKSAELTRAPDKVEKPELDVDAKRGYSAERTLGGNTAKSSKTYSSSKSLGKGGSTEQLKEFWKQEVARAITHNSGKLSEKAKQLLSRLGKDKAKVNWKRELKKFVDKSFTKMVEVMPNKRFIASGTALYGMKAKGKDTLNELIIPVDTSGSISNDQIKVFINEVWNLTKNYDVNKITIIYCSDDIDAIDVVKRGEDPDFTKIATTGGNAKGFIPPFVWIQKEKIKPSVVIYLTDSYAEYPSVNSYGIKRYANRVFWFICVSDSDYYKPPFGKTIHVPIDGRGNFL